MNDYDDDMKQAVLFFSASEVAKTIAEKEQKDKDEVLEELLTRMKWEVE